MMIMTMSRQSMSADAFNGEAVERIDGLGHLGIRNVRLLMYKTQGLNQLRARYHAGRRPSSDDSFHSPAVILPSTLDKPSIMKRYHRRRTTR